MEENQVELQAKINMLVKQRNDALNEVVILVGELAKLKWQLKAIKESSEKPSESL